MNGNTPLRASLWLASIFSLLVASSAWAQEVVINGGFETGTFSNWTVSDSSGFTNIGPDPLFAHSGTFHANLGARGVLGSLSQNLTTANSAYTLSFWLANDSGVPPNEFDVFWNGVAVLILSNSPSFAYTQYTFTVSGLAGTSALEFRYRNDDDFFRLDDVSVSVVPEPQALWLVLPGAAALLGARYFSRKRQA